MRDSVSIPGQGESSETGRQMGMRVRRQRQMRMDEVTGVRGEDLKCSKHLDFLPQCKRESRVMRGFHMSHEEPYSVCPGSPNLDTLFLENMLSLPLKRHSTLCGFFFFLSPLCSLV